MSVPYPCPNCRRELAANGVCPRCGYGQEPQSDRVAL